MAKRKRGELYVGYTWSHYAVIAMLGLGMCVLLLVSGGAMWHWIEGQLYAPPYAIYGYPYATSTPRALRALESNVTSATNLALILPEGAQLILATTSSDMFQNEANSKQFVKTPQHGEDVSVAPDGKTLAYIRSDRLYINNNGKEHVIPTDGDVMMPAWDTSGNMLAFVIREAVGDTVYRVAVESMQPERLITIPEISSPPLTNPATGRLLIIEKLGVKDTAFYTIDPNCATQAACEGSRRDIATVKQTINWADYHPNAASIVFSDMDDGNIYLLATGSGDVQSLVVNGSYKRRPAFNQDGTWLAYTNVTDGNKLELFHVSDSTIRTVPFSNVASVDWFN